MKRLVGLLMVCLMMLGITGVAAEKDNNLLNAYDTIKDLYDEAINLQEEYGETDDAISVLGDLIGYLEGFSDPEALKAHDDTLLYYEYALGRVELRKDEPDYSFAYDQLSRCDDSLYMISDYRQFAKGMAAMEKRDYAKAISALQGLSIREFTQIIQNAIDECKAQYKSSVIADGKAACNADDHERAQEIFNAYLNMFEDDADIIKLRDDCLDTHSQESVEEAAGLEIVNAVSTTPHSMKLTWKGNGDNYTVSWTSDLVWGKDSQSADVTGESYDVEGLLPGTLYRFTIVCKDISVQIDRSTRKAEKYPPMDGEDKLATGTCAMWRFNESRFDFLSSGQTSYEFFNESSSCKKINNRTVELLNNPINESCILFVFTTYGVPEDMSGKPYQLLLHVDDTATLMEEGEFGEEKVCTYRKDIYVLIYDLFDRLVEGYSDLSGKAFQLDLLVDGQFVASTEGTLQ